MRVHSLSLRRNCPRGMARRNAPHPEWLIDRAPLLRQRHILSRDSPRGAVATSAFPAVPLFGKCIMAQVQGDGVIFGGLLVMSELHWLNRNTNGGR